MNQSIELREGFQTVIANVGKGQDEFFERLDLCELAEAFVGQLFVTGQIQPPQIGNVRQVEQVLILQPLPSQFKTPESAYCLQIFNPGTLEFARITGK